MPELPEVETVCRGLDKFIVGKTILGVNILNEKSFSTSSKLITAGSDPAKNTVIPSLAEKKLIEKVVIGAKIIMVRRRAKVLIIDLNSDYSLVIHLKMTGQMIFRGNEIWGGGHPNDSFLAQLPDKSTRVEFSLSAARLLEPRNPKKAAGLSGQGVEKAQAKLFFNDQRKFGWIKLLPTTEIPKMDFIKKLGPEPLIGNPTQEFLTRIRRHNNTTIKAAILDQSVIAGIGNIYADESLWASKIHPSTKVRDLSDKKMRELMKNAIAIMQKAIDSGGSTMKNYIKADGTKGDYLTQFANVFNREGQQCLRCNTVIEKIRVAGRGTHICPKCQKINRGRGGVKLLTF